MGTSIFSILSDYYRKIINLSIYYKYTKVDFKIVLIFVVTTYPQQEIIDMDMTDQEKTEKILREFAKKNGIPISHFHRSGMCFEFTTDPVGAPSSKYQKGGEITREYRMSGTFDAIVEDIYLYKENPRHGDTSQECVYMRHLGSYVFPLINIDEFPDLPNDIRMFIDVVDYAISERPNIAYRKDHNENGNGTFDYYSSYELSLCGKYVVERVNVKHVGLPNPDNDWQCDGYQRYSDIPRVFKYPNNCGKIQRTTLI